MNDAILWKAVWNLLGSLIGIVCVVSAAWNYGDDASKATFWLAVAILLHVLRFPDDEMRPPK